MAAGVCLIFLIPFCAETAEDQDSAPVLIECVDIPSQNNKTIPDDDDTEEIHSHTVVNTKSDLLNRNCREGEAADGLSTQSRCIMSCLPSRGHSWVEKGSYCKEETDNGESVTEKVSVI